MHTEQNLEKILPGWSFTVAKIHFQVHKSQEYLLSVLPSNFFFLQIVSSDSVMQFTLSQGLCISKKHFLPRVATSLLLPKVLIHFHIPLSLSCFLHPFLVSL